MKLSFVTKILNFNPADLFSRQLRTRKLLKNADVLHLVRYAYLFGELHKQSEFIDPTGASQFTFEALLHELEMNE